MTRSRTRTGGFALCIDSADYPASLEPRKLYEVIADPDAESHGQLRVIDESGEDYLYPARYFRVVILPPSLNRLLRRRKARVAAEPRTATKRAAIRRAGAG
jgi:hypothetical protein